MTAAIDNLDLMEGILESNKADIQEINRIVGDLGKEHTGKQSQRVDRLLKMDLYQLNKLKQLEKEKLTTASEEASMGKIYSRDRCMEKSNAVYPKGFMSSAFEDMRKKLLDISGYRSKLINLEQNRKGVVRFVDELPDQIAKALLNDKAMAVVPVSEPTKDLLIEYGYLQWDKEQMRYLSQKDDPDAKEWAAVLGIKNDYELPIGSDHADDNRHSDFNLQSLLFEPALNVNLKKLASEAKTSIDETGNNILFLSLGFLEWHDQAEEGQKRLAPLYMIPVRIEKESVRGVAVYKLKYTGEDIIPNLTLREKLSIDFDLRLPDVVDPNDQERLLLPEEYLEEVSALISRKSNDPIISRWRVRCYGTLATLSLGKLLMYLDLDPNRWPKGEGNLLQHDVIRRFFQDERCASEVTPGYEEAYILDDVPGIHHNYPMIDDADSSQMSVLIDVLNGNSMVVEGPPGTGKSQTITNLIAAAIAQGKTVLFVAEKQAALDVVKRRMDKVGLGDFCLDLHSDKAQKRLVLDSFGERITNQNQYSHSLEDYELQVARYERAREQLQVYANMVNQPWKSTGFTIHEILSAATRYAKQVEPLKYKDVALDSVSGSNFSRIQLDQQLEQLEVFYNYLGIVSKQLDDPGNWLSHPWYGVSNKQLISADHDQIVDVLKEWNISLASFVSTLSSKFAELGIGQEYFQTLPKLEALIGTWSSIPSLAGEECLDAFSRIQQSDLMVLESAIEHYKKISEGYKNARSVFLPKLIENIEKIEDIDSAISNLIDLGVKPTTSFDELSKSLTLLEDTISKYEKINRVRLDLFPHMDSDIRNLFPASQDGFYELSQFVKHTNHLPSKYIKYREDVFENEELPAVLEEVKLKLGILNNEKVKQNNIFDLNNLPSPEKIRKYSIALAETSFLSWLNSSWREIKRAVTSFSKETKFEYSAMAVALEELVKWLDFCKEFNESKKYKEVLGTQFEELNTDCKRIATLYDWYRRVRKDYGIGFGQRVPLAKALFTMKPDVFKGVQKLCSEGFVSDVEAFAHNLELLSHVFTEVSSLTSKEQDFDQDVNPLQVLLFQIREDLQKCQGYLVNPNMPQSELVAAIADLKELISTEYELDQLDINNRFFCNKIDLTIDNRGRFPTDFSRLLATVKYLKSLYKSTENNDILSIIINNKGQDSIDRMVKEGCDLNRQIDELAKKEQRFMALSASSRGHWFCDNGLKIEAIEKRNSLAINNAQWLDSWLKYLFAKERMESGGFGQLKEYLIRQDFTLEHAQNVMRFAIYQCLAREVYSQNLKLAERSGHEQTALQLQFLKYDTKLKELQRKRVAALAARRKVPAGVGGARVASYTDDYLLKHELKKKSRYQSIRNLVTRAGAAMQAYKPCFMMSPMAVAKYIPPGSLKFDLVIMDEASQVKPEYALSSFARGNQIMVVGDPKQLPPTTFFEKSVSNDGNMWDDNDVSIVEDSESILEALGGQFTNRQLRWHYRSRHESLIEFSNHHFYSSNLIVFPSPWSESDEYGIKFNFVPNGRFLKGVNIPESHVVVAAVCKHLVDCPNESIGVVAMNSRQRDQIEADLEAAIAKDGVLCSAYEKNRLSEDPLFIKNLENVQGDERDVICISFTYGPQEKGSTSIPQRFGPINGANGWRRLNVLFTRSKKRIQVYSSMTANQIILSDTSSLGVKSLKGYLEFAQTGRLVGQTATAGREPDSDFEIAVMDALSREGFECVPQVGVADFFIDIAVRDPGMPGRYLMGIECDGATYHSSKSTRDRDRVRQAVLEGLDWNIKRIWSTDWFKHPEAELKPIIEELKALATPISEQVKVSDDVVIQTRSSQRDSVDYLSSTSHTLEESLHNFAVNVIEKDSPDTEPEKRLLRPEMLERLVLTRPTNRDDFALDIPAYLRTNTSTIEADKFLDNVLEIIADYDELSASE